MNHVLFQVLLFDTQSILNHYQVDLSIRKQNNSEFSLMKIFQQTLSFDCSKRCNKAACSSFLVFNSLLSVSFGLLPIRARCRF